MRRVFVDTSGWLAVLVLSDSHHKNAVATYSGLLASGIDLVTHDGILLEIGNALSSTKTRNTAVKLTESISNSRRIEIVSLTPALLEASWELYTARTDKNWGIVDCVSFVVMEQLGMVEALTADRHFEQAGFRKLL